MELKPGTIETLKIKTETYYSLQKLRIQTQLRIKAFVRDERLDEATSSSLHFWLDKHVRDKEDAIKEEITENIKDIPIWKEFLKDVYGIGPCLAGSFIAGIQDISRFEHVASLWKYAGQDVLLYCPKCHKEVERTGKVTEFCPDCNIEAHGEAPRRIKNRKISWNPFLRMTVFKATDSFIKQDVAKSLYRQLYDEKKNFYKRKFPEWNICRLCGSRLIERKGKPDKCSKAGCKGQSGGIPHPIRKKKDGTPIYIHTKDHIHMMSKRYAGKIFLEHLWLNWRQLDGLSVTKPWIIEHGGHRDYIEAVA